MDDSDHSTSSATGGDGSSVDGNGRSRTRRRFLATGIAGLAGLAVGLGSAAGRKRVGDAVVAAGGGGEYSSLNPAIDDAEPGDVLCVYPGEYDGTVVVDVPNLTLVSMRPGGATIRGGWTAAGPALSVRADDVTVQGFRVTHPDGRLGITVDSDLANVTLALNHVTEIGPFETPGATGISVGTPQSNLTVADNVVENVRSVLADEIAYPVSRGIALNAAPDIDSGGGDEEVAADSSTDSERSASLTDSVVRGNVVRWLSSDYACRGIALAADAARVAVSGNDLYAMEASNRDNEPKPYAWAFHSSARTDAVEFKHNLVDDVTASEYVGTGVMVRGEPDGLSVTENDLTTTLGIQNSTATPLSATLNWWGHRNGPRSVGSNRSADDGRRLDGQGAYVGPVRAEPWLTGTIRTSDDRTNRYVDTRLSREELSQPSESVHFWFPTIQ